MKTIIATLLFVVKDGKILLAEKKIGFGQGLLNGVGGKVERGETVEHAMIREAEEEVGVVPTVFEKVAINDFEVYYRGEVCYFVTHIFIASEFKGKPVESEEMKPMWVDLDKIPYDKMWSDDQFWLPRVLAGEKLKCHFVFDKGNKILFQDIQSVDGFDSECVKRMTITEAQKQVYENKVAKGFKVSDVSQEFCLLYGEVSEAYDAWLKKKGDIGEELADVAIFLLGLAEIVGVSLEDEIEKKILKNKKRKYEVKNGVVIKKK